MLLEELDKKIETKNATIGVVGLGYVGFPVACAFADAGFKVIGVDIKSSRIEGIRSGLNPIEGEEPGLAQLLTDVQRTGRLRVTTDHGELKQADVILIDVETPVDANNRPEYLALRAACRSVGPILRQGALVIVESTVAPGTIDKVVGPLLADNSGGVLNKDFFLGACPERVMPGKLLLNLRTMSRVCGGSTADTASVMVTLYRNIVDADLDTSDPVTAEMVKTTENTYRDVQIAFANEVALISEVVGADVWRVRELVNKSPGRSMHFPGAGVGGHCIPKDPWLLAHGAGDGTAIRLIPAARAVNESMPGHMAQMLQEELAAIEIDMVQARIAVLGYAYLEDSDDTRNSPSRLFVKLVRALGSEVRIHDPWVPEYQGDLLELTAGCDAVVLMVAHQAYRKLDLKALQRTLRTPIMIDGRRLFDARRARAAGFFYRLVGQGAGDSAAHGRL